MIRLLLLIATLFVSLFALAQKDAESINVYLQKGQYKQAQSYTDSILEIRKFGRDPYYHYLSGGVYRGLFESSDPSDLDSRTKFIKKSFQQFLSAFDQSGNAGNKIYLNSSIQVLDISLAYIAELLESDEDSSALSLNAYLFTLCNKQKSFPRDKIANTGVKYALILEQKENYKAAIEVYQALISEKNYSPEVFLNLSYLYQSENDFERVVEVLLEGRKLFPASNVLNVELVNYAMQSDNSEKVMKELESAYEKDSSNFQLVTTLATLFDKLEQYEKAKSYYKAALELNPDLLELHYNLAVLLYNQYIELNKFLMTGNSDLSFQDINAQRNRLIRQCRKRFEFLVEKDFKKEEIVQILEKLEE